MSYYEYTLGLSKHLALFEPTIQKYPPGSAAKPSGNQIFIETNIIPIESESDAFGDGVTILDTGIFRSTIYYPLGVGAAKLVQLASQLREHFFPVNGRGLAIVEGGSLIRVERPPRISTIMEPNDVHSAHIAIDVDVYFYCHIEPEQ